MTAEGSALTRFKRAIKRKNLLGAEMTLREMGRVGLPEALDYLVLLTCRHARSKSEPAPGEIDGLAPPRCGTGRSTWCYWTH